MSTRSLTVEQLDELSLFIAAVTDATRTHGPRLYGTIEIDTDPETAAAPILSLQYDADEVEYVLVTSDDEQ